jgi:integrase
VEPWPLPALDKFEAEAKGTPWIGFMLAFYTGQRQADVLAMPWSKIDNDVIEVKQEKTGRYVWVPLHPRFKAALETLKIEQKARLADRTDRGLRAVTGLTIVQREDGQRYTKDGFGSVWQREQVRVGIKLPFHGLRKSAVIALLEAGCTTDEVKSITGHSTDEMVTHYGKKVNQRKLARAAIDKLVGAENL